MRSRPRGTPRLPASLLSRSRSRGTLRSAARQLRGDVLQEDARRAGHQRAERFDGGLRVYAGAAPHFVTSARLDHGLADELHVFVVPLLLGPRGRPGAVDWAGPENPSDAPRIDPPRWELCGGEAYVWGPLKYPKKSGRTSPG